MRIRATWSSVFSQQRGYRLRCFLGRILLLFALLICVNPPARANVCVSPTVHVRSVRGIVTDQVGEPIAGATVLLKVGKETKAEAKTDSTVIFRLDARSGPYELSVHRSAFVNAWTPLDVGSGLKSLLGSSTLYVILAVGVQDCPPNITTSKREHIRQIQIFKAQLEAKK